VSNPPSDRPVEPPSPGAPPPARGGAASDLWGFVRENRKWWLYPVLGVLLLVGALLILTATAAGPFIYTLF
jgi:hypothetical protein